MICAVKEQVVLRGDGFGVGGGKVRVVCDVYWEWVEAVHLLVSVPFSKCHSIVRAVGQDFLYSLTEIYHEAFSLGHADPRRGVADLAVQVRRLDRVAIHDADGAHTGASEVSCCGTAKAPCPYNEDGRGSETELAYGASFSGCTAARLTMWVSYVLTCNADAGKNQLP